MDQDTVLIPIIVVNHLSIIDTTTEEEKLYINGLQESLHYFIEKEILNKEMSRRKSYEILKRFVKGYISLFNKDNDKKSYMWLDNSDYIILSDETDLDSYNERYSDVLKRTLKRMKSKDINKNPIMLFDICLFEKSSPICFYMLG